ncbi:hypothetical protein [Streptomyces sp. YIM B13518]|uniref:hypothetical protein n=1 Tax=Streptomyces sp. YIM B13518 TaxID=3366316 RepID=UPI0036CA93CD
MRGSESVLRAVGDLHVSYGENRAVVEKPEPGSPGDWLIAATRDEPAAVAGRVGA